MFRYISRQEYAPDRYPTYINGPSYVLTRLAIERLAAHASDYDFLRMEDVLFCGIISQALNIEQVGSHRFFYGLKTSEDCTVDRISNHVAYQMSMTEYWLFQLGKPHRCLGIAAINPL